MSSRPTATVPEQHEENLGGADPTDGHDATTTAPVLASSSSPTAAQADLAHSRAASHADLKTTSREAASATQTSTSDAVQEDASALVCDPATSPTGCSFAHTGELLIDGLGVDGRNHLLGERGWADAPEPLPFAYVLPAGAALPAHVRRGGRTVTPLRKLDSNATSACTASDRAAVATAAAAAALVRASPCATASTPSFAPCSSRASSCSRASRRPARLASDGGGANGGVVERAQRHFGRTWRAFGGDGLVDGGRRSADGDESAGARSRRRLSKMDEEKGLATEGEAAVGAATTGGPTAASVGVHPIRAMYGVSTLDIAQGTTCYPIGQADFISYLATRRHEHEDTMLDLPDLTMLGGAEDSLEMSRSGHEPHASTASNESEKKRPMDPTKLLKRGVGSRPPQRQGDELDAFNFVVACERYRHRFDLLRTPSRLKSPDVETVDRMIVVRTGLSSAPPTSDAQAGATCDAPLGTSGEAAVTPPPSDEKTLTDVESLLANLEPAEQPMRSRLASLLRDYVGAEIGRSGKERCRRSPALLAWMCDLGLLSDATIRQALARAELTTHPDVLRPLSDAVLTHLDAHALPGFLVESSRNLKSRTKVGRLLVGIVFTAVAVTLSVLLMVKPSPFVPSSAPSPRAVARWWRLLTLPLWIAGLGYILAAWTGVCVWLTLRGTYEPKADRASPASAPASSDTVASVATFHEEGDVEASATSTHAAPTSGPGAAPPDDQDHESKWLMAPEIKSLLLRLVGKSGSRNGDGAGDHEARPPPTGREGSRASQDSSSATRTRTSAAAAGLTISTSGHGAVASTTTSPASPTSPRTLLHPASPVTTSTGVPLAEPMRMPVTVLADGSGALVPAVIVPNAGGVGGGVAVSSQPPSSTILSPSSSASASVSTASPSVTGHQSRTFGVPGLPLAIGISKTHSPASLIVVGGNGGATGTGVAGGLDASLPAAVVPAGAVAGSPTTGATTFRLAPVAAAAPSESSRWSSSKERRAANAIATATATTTADTTNRSASPAPALAQSWGEPTTTAATTGASTAPGGNHSPGRPSWASPRRAWRAAKNLTGFADGTRAVRDHRVRRVHQRAALRSMVWTTLAATALVLVLLAVPDS